MIACCPHMRREAVALGLASWRDNSSPPACRNQASGAMGEGLLKPKQAEEVHYVPEQQPSLRTKLVACLQYGLVSTSITLFNRAVFSVYHFNYPSFVTLVQILVSLVYMYALKWTGYMELGPLSLETSKEVGRRQQGW